MPQCRYRTGFLFVLALSTPLAGQTPAPTSDYSQEAIVIERFVSKRAFALDGSSVRDDEFRIRVQSAAGVQQIGQVIIPYMKDVASVEVHYVRVRKPGGAVVETPPATALDLPADITRAAPTFTDLHARHINVQGLQPGDTLEYAYRIRERSLIPGEFWLEESFPDGVILLDGVLEVSMPASITPTVKNLSTKPAVFIDAGERTFVWRYSTLRRPSERETAVRAYARKDLRADVQMTTFRDWPALGERLRPLYQDRVAVTPAIREKALELTRAASTPEEKSRALYAFVSTGIRYIAVSMGIGRIQPHAAADVLNNGFGDCKDKHALLVAMLDAVGISASAALIGPGDPFDADVPSPAQFTHVITAVSGVAGITWLDTTLEVAPFGFLMGNERDVSVLLLPRTGSPALARTPAEPLRVNLWRIETDATLSGQGRLQATVRETVTGDTEVLMRALFRNLPQAQWPELMRQFPVPSRFGGSVTDIEITPPEDTERMFEIRYRYTVDNFSDWAGRRITPPVPFAVAPLPDSPIPVSVGNIGRTVATARLELPPGFEPTLPAWTSKDLVVDREFARYQARLSLKGRTVEIERDLLVKQDKLGVHQFEAYRTYFDAIAEASIEVELRPVAP